MDVAQYIRPPQKATRSTANEDARACTALSSTALICARTIVLQDYCELGSLSSLLRSGCNRIRPPGGALAGTGGPPHSPGTAATRGMGLPGAGSDAAGGWRVPALMEQAVDMRVGGVGVGGARARGQGKLEPPSLPACASPSLPLAAAKHRSLCAYVCVCPLPPRPPC